MPQLDSAEEIHRQLTLWNQSLELNWKIELLNEIQRGRFYIAGSEAGRARVLARLAHGQLHIVIASLAALLAPAPDPENLRNSEITLEVGSEYPFGKLIESLIKLDYDDEYEVANPGEFSRRGGIIDIFSPGAEKPARIEFFGDEIESIRYFDPATQRSLPGTVKSYRIINRCTVQTLTDEAGQAFDGTVPALE